jgi:hypothetical protein
VKKKVYIAMLGLLAAFNEALFAAVCGSNSCDSCLFTMPLCKRARKVTEDIEKLAADVEEKG